MYYQGASFINWYTCIRARVKKGCTLFSEVYPVRIPRAFISTVDKGKHGTSSGGCAVFVLDGLARHSRRVCAVFVLVPAVSYLSPGNVYINSGQGVDTARPPEVVPRFGQYKRGINLKFRLHVNDLWCSKLEVNFKFPKPWQNLMVNLARLTTSCGGSHSNFGNVWMYKLRGFTSLIYL